MPKVIGLTGGIATGKSTVSKMLKERGFYIVDADVASRKAVETGSKGLRQVEEVFGKKAILNGEMNRQYVGSIVFKDEDMRKKLNNIVHPIVREIMEEEKQLGLKKDKNVIMDIPLLFENNLQDTVDETWLVYTTKETQIVRLKQRNQLTDEEALSRIKSQMPIEEKKEMADVIIDNNGSLVDLTQNIETLLTNNFNI
ncbi:MULTISPECIES: dephospho-CoA kinase [Mammaliicoccus]|uniref:Dephospho-CoA kinase n=2 Tax=Mammaliicoccus fleurettii TaxID=150056 RepID=A0ABS5MNH3_9STAP|nr:MULTISPECIES: dephospho-CoA kinase [Mammaliicoccus]MBL0847691.1 dephospho-CoA kinase [Mammaliicoccus fleurettii]MBO3062292.1 dephospho-CoA kinase [Mammaliicoccus fleurettii]MBS3672404.1 dephospho-CoA kinase [Mammaliicoccus fleurettii]MBS3697475.1 dephospho-CoA kinase [Mammaliicoccus fleurettii]MBW0764255.1 dephospho-CoA kinase [Mammaliicoccus fleurettii]